MRHGKVDPRERNTGLGHIPSSTPRDIVTSDLCWGKEHVRSGPRGARSVMDYAACNVVYVDRTAREDKVVKRDDATSPASTEIAPNHAVEYAPVQPSPSSVEDNLRTLLGTFSEGMLAYSSLNIELTSLSPHLHVWQILYIKTVRIESSVNCRINTYPRPYRYPLRRSIARTNLAGTSNPFSKFQRTH